MLIFFSVPFLFVVNGMWCTPALSRLIVTRVGPCVDKKREIVTLSEMSLNRDNYDYSLKGKFNITRDVEDGWAVKATMQKCHDIRNLDTCDFYKSVSIVKSGCLDAEEEDVYSMFFTYVSPKLECPIKAGAYTVNEFPFFTEDSDLTAAESKISTSVFGYTYRLEGFDDEEERILCVEAYLRMIYVRNHDWVGDKRVSNYFNQSAVGADDKGTEDKDADADETDEENDKEENDGKEFDDKETDSEANDDEGTAVETADAEEEETNDEEDEESLSRFTVLPLNT